MRGRLGLLLGIAGIAGVAGAAACGGASESGLFGETGASSATDPQGGGGDPPATTSPPSTGAPPGSPPCQSATYYRDRDGDGVGGDETKTSCTSPGDEWTTTGGDCDDDNEHVFPGQTSYFSASYAKKGNKSYDYDCSGKEEQAPPQKKAAGQCTVSDNTACKGEGYVPVPRAGGTSGSGADLLCGATKYQNCRFVAGVPTSFCESIIVDAPSPVSCR